VKRIWREEILPEDSMKNSVRNSLQARENLCVGLEKEDTFSWIQ